MYMASPNRKSRSFLTWRTVVPFIVALQLPPMGVAAQEPVAMVTDLLGSGEIATPGGEPQACEILSYLAPQSRVTIGEASSLTLVFFESSREYRFTGPAEIVIGAAEPDTASGAEPEVEHRTLAEQTSLSPETVSGYRQAAIVLRGDVNTRLRLLSPRNISILETHPVFRWEPLAVGTQYRFVLANDAGRTLVDTPLTATELKLSKAVPIERGAYYTWRVEARIASGDTYVASADFIVVSEDERQRVEAMRPGQSASFSERVIFARFLERLDLGEEAQRYWRALAAERPASAELRARAERSLP